MLDTEPRGRPRDVVVIGCSAGGLQVLGPLIRELPVPLRAAVAIVIHRAAGYRSWMAQVLGQGAAIEVVEPADGDTFKPGRVHVAPAGLHMTIRGGLVRLDRGPKQHHTRPAIDPLFTSVATSYGGRVAGVLLTGGLSDGVAGLISIKAAGGLSVVQDPEEAQFPSMPSNALRYDHVDLVVGTAALPAVLAGLVAGYSVDQVTAGCQPGTRRAWTSTDDDESPVSERSG